MRRGADAIERPEAEMAEIIHDIFLSYAREDLERVRHLVDAFKKRDCRIIWDLEVRTGKTWTQEIQDAIDRSLCIIIVWSRHSVRSEWVIEEALEAKDKMKEIIPVLLDDVTPPFGFRRLHAANLVDWDGDDRVESFVRLSRDVLKILRESRAAQPTAPEAGADSAAHRGTTTTQGHWLRVPDAAAVEEAARRVALTVYVAWVSEPLRGARVRIRRELEGRGHRVVPPAGDPPAESAIEDEVRRCLLQSDLSIHALGEQFLPLRGEADRSLDQLQLEAAAERSDKEPRFSRFIWLAGSEPIEDERQRTVIGNLLHKALGPRDELLEASMEDLLDLVLERLQRPQKMGG